MKKFSVLIFALVLLVVTSLPVLSQVPQGFKFQSVARDVAGVPLNDASLGLRISIRDLTPDGVIVYQETHLAETNAFGLFSISVGGGTPASGDFSTIDWGTGAKYIEVEADFNGGTSYASMGISELLSVPYALYAHGGMTGKEGPMGPQGLQGLGILHGDVDPSSETGRDGEFFINTATNKLFGPRADGVWPEGMPLTGPVGEKGEQGIDGLRILNGPGDPSLDTGRDGEFYINTTLNKLFGPKAAGVWPEGVSLTGPQGEKGDAGVDGLNVLYGSDDPTLNEGVDGEFFINITTNSLFGPKAEGAWPEGIALVGPPGPDGATNAWGLAGTAGTVDGTHFIGTTDNVPLTIKMNNEKAGRVELGAVFLGYRAGNSNTVSYNVGFGPYALYANTTGQYNSANGYQALYSNTTGDSNTASGYRAMLHNTTGNHNTANGYQSLISNTTGSGNTGNGLFSLYYNATGNHNSANGYEALFSNATGSYNTASGYLALRSNVAGSNATAIGAGAMQYANNTSTAFDNANIAVGFEALRGSTNAAWNTGNWNTAVGYQALFNNRAGQSNSAHGFQALHSNINGRQNTVLGYQGLYSNNSGNDNTAVGYQSMHDNTSGYNNAATGFQALFSNTFGSSNVANGYQALYSNSTGSANAAIGTAALYSNTSGYQNVAIGNAPLHKNTDGYRNIAIGYQAQYENTSGYQNVAIGYQALYNNLTGDDNTAIGRNALDANTTGSRNTAIGYSADVTNGDLTNATAIGYAARVNASNKVRIGNTQVDVVESPVAITVSSDRRLKSNITDSELGLRFILALHPVQYTMNDGNGKTDYGFIAQELKTVLGDRDVNMIGSDGEYYTVRYNDLIAPLVKAIQEQQRMIDTLKAENNEWREYIERSAVTRKKARLELQERMQKLEALLIETP